MKKSLLTLLLLLFSTSLAYAQLRIELGTKLKTLDKFSELSTTPIKELPIHATIGYELNLSKYLYLEVEGTFTKENILLDNEEAKPIVEKIDLLATLIPSLKGNTPFPRYYSSSIKIPLNFGVRIPLVGNLALSLEAGPYVMLNISSEIGYEDSDKFDISKIKTTIESEKFATKREYGVNASTSLSYSKLHLRFGAEYNLTDKIDTDKGVSDNFNAIKPLFKNINEDKLSYYITLGINI